MHHATDTVINALHKKHLKLAKCMSGHMTSVPDISCWSRDL